MATIDVTGTGMSCCRMPGTLGMRSRHHSTADPLCVRRFWVGFGLGLRAGGQTWHLGPAGFVGGSWVFGKSLPGFSLRRGRVLLSPARVFVAVSGVCLRL